MSTKKRGASSAIKKPRGRPRKNTDDSSEKKTKHTKKLAADALIQLRSTPAADTSEEETAATADSMEPPTTPPPPTTMTKVQEDISSLAAALGGFISKQIQKDENVAEVKTLKRDFDSYKAGTKQTLDNVSHLTAEIDQRLSDAAHAIDIHADLISGLTTKVQKNSVSSDAAPIKQQLDELSKAVQGIRTAVNGSVMQSLKSLEARIAVVEERQRQQPISLL
jgi:hypothetical protein